jgi:hypothetical protein
MNSTRTTRRDSSSSLSRGCANHSALATATSLNRSAMWTYSFAIAYRSTNRSQSTAALTAPPDR